MGEEGREGEFLIPSPLLSFWFLLVLSPSLLSVCYTYRPGGQITFPYRYIETRAPTKGFPKKRHKKLGVETLTNFLIETGSSLLVNPVLYTPGLALLCVFVSGDGRMCTTTTNTMRGGSTTYVGEEEWIETEEEGRRGVATEGGGGMDCIAGNR